MDEVFFIVPNLGGGGAERVMTIIANHIAASGYHVTFLLTKSGDIVYPLKEDISVIVNRGNTNAYGQIRFIRSNLKNKSRSVAISFFTYQNMYLMFAKKGLQVKTILSERNDPAKTLYGRNWMNWIRNLLYSKADRIVFQTQGAKDYFPQKIRDKGIVILNPIEENLPVPYSGERKKEIVTVGRLTRQKNYPLLLKAYAKTLAVHPDYCLKIYGAGELETELKELASALNIGTRVKFMGFCNDIQNMIVESGLFVIASDFEGLSNALLEAMAIGLPCVSTDSPPGGARMVIKDGENGLLVRVGDTEELFGAICKVIENPELAEKMGRKASAIRERLSKKEICSQWVDLIVSL